MVMAIKNVQADLPSGYSMNLHNFEDNKDINLWAGQNTGTNTWVPYQTSQKQIRVQVKNASGGVDAEFFLWDDHFKLQCSSNSSIGTILTVSGNADIGIKVTATGVQAHFA